MSDNTIERWPSITAEGDFDWTSIPENDRESIALIILDLINSTIEALNNIIFGFNPFGLNIRSSPTYRTKPIEDAELGGIQRNPEDNVIDEIDQLVDWQIRHGETGGW